MPVNAKEYREHLYRLRSHPPVAHDDFVDQRDSFLHVYLSLIPFLVLEYLVEVNYELLPSGLVFPLGYLLFWAFYYTYYKPGFLEERLSTPKKWDLNAIPTILVGVTIWFVKVTVVELSGILFGRWLFRRRKTGAAEASRPRPQAHHATGAGPRPHAHSQANARANPGAENTRSFRPPPPPPRPSSSLPREIATALQILGLSESTSSWNEIHHRYRELAKQYHPDLNHEITAVGRRFMMVDAAYRKLSAVKGRYFPEKRDHG